jgi:hypothetical protein
MEVKISIGGYQTLKGSDEKVVIKENKVTQLKEEDKKNGK